MNIKSYTRQRDALLLSMDEQRIKRFIETYAPHIAKELKKHDDEFFWCMVHKMRTGSTGLPEDERQKSREWLWARGYQSLDGAQP